MEARSGARPRPINRPRPVAAAVYVVWRAACQAYHVLRVRVRAKGSPRAVGGLYAGVLVRWQCVAMAGEAGECRRWLERAGDGWRVPKSGRLCERWARDRGRGREMGARW